MSHQELASRASCAWRLPLENRHTTLGGEEMSDGDFVKRYRALILRPPQPGLILAPAAIDRYEIQPRLPQLAASDRYEMLELVGAEPNSALADDVQPWIPEAVDDHALILPEGTRMGLQARPLSGKEYPRTK